MEYDKDKLFSYDNLFSNDPLELECADVFQVSELSIIEGGEISAHLQHCDEITYAVSGSAVFVSDTYSETVKAGQIHFIKKGHEHTILASQNESFRFLCIGFEPNIKNNCAARLYDFINNLPYFIIHDNGTVKNLSEYLIREFYYQDSMSLDMINFYLSQIFITILRILSNIHTVSLRKTSERFINPTIYKILRYIDSEYMNLKTVKEISKALSYNEYYISHLFKEKLGITLKQYLIKKKIMYSCKLLTETDLSIEQISEKLMISSAHSFRRLFKRYINMTPSEYKEKLSCDL